MVLSVIDILLATYNGEKYLDAQIESLFEQSYKNWRIIAHDDGSTDSTPDILRRWQSEHPDKFIYLDDGVKTGGAKNNFAYLATQSTSPYIMFCDQDDVWLNNKIDLTFSKMLEIEAGSKDIPILVHTDLCVVDSELNRISSSMAEYSKFPKRDCSLDELVLRNNITGCTVMANKCAVDLIRDNTPVQAVMHDWWLGLVVLKNGGIIRYIDKPLIKYRQHGANSVGAVGVTKKIFSFICSMDVDNFSNRYYQARLIIPDLKFPVFILNRIFFVLKLLFK